ncbi:hypothetical protein Tco_0491003 [Tanacetum coccineum]
MNARTKKPKVVPISASKPKRKANKSVATPHKKTVASDTTIQKSKSYHKELYENTNQEWKWWIAKRCPSGYKWTQKPLRTKKIWMPKIRKEDDETPEVPQRLSSHDDSTQFFKLKLLLLSVRQRNKEYLEQDTHAYFLEEGIGTSDATLEHLNSRHCQKTEPHAVVSLRTKGVNYDNADLSPKTKCGSFRRKADRSHQDGQEIHPLEKSWKSNHAIQTRRQLAHRSEMWDELHQFDRLKVWELVDKPFGKMIIKLKWLWKNKKDEDHTVIRNKARLVWACRSEGHYITWRQYFTTRMIKRFTVADDLKECSRITIKDKSKELCSKITTCRTMIVLEESKTTSQSQRSTHRMLRFKL